MLKRAAEGKRDVERTQTPSHCPFTGATGSEYTGVDNEESREKIMNKVTAEVRNVCECREKGLMSIWAAERLHTCVIHACALQCQRCVVATVA